jgi:cytochrome P450
LENSYFNLTFNQGPQICPGKELAIFTMTYFMKHFLKTFKNKNLKSIHPTLDTNYIPQMINPCNFKIEFDI